MVGKPSGKVHVSVSLPFSLRRRLPGDRPRERLRDLGLDRRRPLGPTPEEPSSEPDDDES